MIGKNLRLRTGVNLLLLRKLGQFFHCAQSQSILRAFILTVLKNIKTKGTYE